MRTTATRSRELLILVTGQARFEAGAAALARNRAFFARTAARRRDILLLTDSALIEYFGRAGEPSRRPSPFIDHHSRALPSSAVCPRQCNPP